MTGGANGVKHYTASPPEACKQGRFSGLMSPRLATLEEVPDRVVTTQLTLETSHLRLALVKFSTSSIALSPLLSCHLHAIPAPFTPQTSIYLYN